MLTPPCLLHPVPRQPGLDPKLSAAMKAELAALQGQQLQNLKQERERKYAVRYHRVRYCASAPSQVNYGGAKEEDLPDGKVARMRLPCGTCCALH